MRHTLIKIYPILLLLCCLFNCKDPERGLFEIRGNLEAEIDSIGLYPSYISKIFIETNYNDYSQIDNQGFLFKGKIPHAYMFNLHSREYGISEPFFIEEGKVEIQSKMINRDRKIFFVNAQDKSRSQVEYENLKAAKLDPINQLMRNAETREDAKIFQLQLIDVLLAYTKENPNSYVALWLLIDQYCWNGYEYNSGYEEALSFFSDNIKTTKLYQSFKESLIKSKTLSFKNKSIDLKDFAGNAVTLNNNILKNHKYTLIDFWFSNCGPCLATMPKYKPIYKDFKDKGFEIMSISIDGTKKIEDWKRVVLEQDFNWVHYLDENGVESQKMNITSFPTTFLVDSSGEILLKNASIEAIIKVLEDNLN
jgi:thiol-disulfide isomerase/thioredoxin